MYDDERDYIIEYYEFSAEKIRLDKLAEEEYYDFLQEMEEAQEDDYKRTGRF